MDTNMDASAFTGHTPTKKRSRVEQSVDDANNLKDSSGTLFLVDTTVACKQDAEKDIEMEVKTASYSIGDLTRGELKIAKDLSVEHMESVLFMEIPILQDKRAHIPLQNSFGHGKGVSPRKMRQSPRKVMQVEPTTNHFLEEFGASGPSWTTRNDSSVTLINPFNDDYSGSFAFEASKDSPTLNAIRIIANIDGNQTPKLAEFTKCIMLIRQQSNARPSHFSTNLTTANPRIGEIRNFVVGHGEMKLRIEDVDTPIICGIFVEILDSLGDIIPKQLHQACQGILALNQASISARKPMGTNKSNSGTTIKTPNECIRDLMSSLLILLPKDSLILLQTVCEFCCELYQGAHIQKRNGWAREMAMVLGPVCMTDTGTTKLVSGKRGYDPKEFYTSFFELLLYSHGLNNESCNADSQRQIWCVKEQTMKRIKRQILMERTPSKRSMSTANTPRKSVTRSLLKPRLFGTCSRRITSKVLFEKQPVSSKFIAYDTDGMIFDSANSSITLEGLDAMDREKFSKRLRLY